jgi:hypothetical protein
MADADKPETDKAKSNEKPVIVVREHWLTATAKAAVQTAVLGIPSYIAYVDMAKTIDNIPERVLAAAVVGIATLGGGIAGMVAGPIVLGAGFALAGAGLGYLASVASSIEINKKSTLADKIKNLDFSFNEDFALIGAIVGVCAGVPVGLYEGVQKGFGDTYTSVRDFMVEKYNASARTGSFNTSLNIGEESYEMTFPNMQGSAFIPT